MTAGTERVRVQVLGPLRVLDGAGADRTPDGLLQQRLLACLVLHRGHVVSVDALTEALWPAAPPQDPAGALQNHVSRLRRGLPDGLIESVGAGYRLEPSGVEVDTDRLADLVATGEGGDELAALLGGWQGPAYPELDELDEGRAEAARLEELRGRGREVRAEWRLARGDTDGLVAELTALAAEDPLRERPQALLMDVLAATGRTAEALRTYDELRRRLGDELGTEPSPALQARHGELLAGEAPPSRWVPTSRLPAPLSSIVGRDELASEVAGLVAAHRLVTLVGPGGVGKTRLLVEVGHRLRSTAPERPVVLCELATADADSVVEVVASALGVEPRPRVEMDQLVADQIDEAPVVLLFDNCEHVLDAAAELAEHLLVHCGGLRVVATSRERLRLPGECVARVPSLPAADTDAPAVALFVERARAVAPGFEPEGAALDRVAEIVRRLDGLPLAIELAAARLHTHSVEEVAAGLDRRFALLDAGSRTSTRHGSLWAAASWSYDLLSEDLRRTFADLSAFAGPFTAADAAAVIGIDEVGAARSLAQLGERSLVMRAADRRFVLLDTLRAFGAEQLTAEGRAGEVGERHAHHYLDVVVRADASLLDPSASALEEVDAAVPELRTALSWFLDHGDVDRAGRLVASLGDFGVMRLRPDIMAWAERVTAADPEDRSSWAPRLWVVGSYAAWMAGDMDESAARSARALEVVERSGREMIPEVAVMVGNSALFAGRLEEAARWYRRSIEAAGGNRARRWFAAATELLALGYAGDPSTGERAEALLAEVGEEATVFAAYAWYCAGEADLATDPERARLRLAKALELGERSNSSFVTGVAGASAASLAARSGDAEVAAAHYRRLLSDWKQAGVRSTRWTAMRSIAVLLDRLGRPREAAVLEGAVRATVEGHRIFGADAVALDELRERLRRQLGDGAYEAARAEGEALDGDAAVDLALRAL